MDGASLQTWLVGLAAGVTALAAALAPLKGGFTAWLQYRVDMRKAEALQVDTARAIPSSALAEATGATMLMDAIADVAAAIREGNAARQNQEARETKERLDQAMDAIKDMAERDRHRDEQPRRR